ncbi:BRO family protein [Victivallis vadensis]|uniref:BRO family protein n=1 Tax=Victivallis vadensis TaxID=172901 RepID=UPI0023F54745|nr:BRO family protein [Victivallis vadensis]
MSKKELSVFNFEESHPVRVILQNEEPWFIGNDVCAALCLGNPRSSLALLEEDEKGVHNMDTPSGQQEMTIINEPGLYSLVLRSRKPEAKKFKRWITHEVLPAIRRTGSYAVPSVPSVPVRESPCSEQPELPLSASRPQPQFLPEAVYRGVPVISLPRLAQQLGVTPNQIHGALHNNRAGLIENAELFRVKGGYALRAAGCGNIFGRRTHLLNLFTESGAAKIRAYLFPDLPVPAPAVAAEPLPQVKAELPLPALSIPLRKKSPGTRCFRFRVDDLPECFTDSATGMLLKKLNEAGYDVSREIAETASIHNAVKGLLHIADRAVEHLNVIHRCIGEIPEGEAVKIVERDWIRKLKDDGVGIELNYVERMHN